MPEQILWLLLDPELGISASILDPEKNRTPEQQVAYAERQIRNAMAMLAGEQQADLYEMMESPVDLSALPDEPPERRDPSRPHPFRRYSIMELLDLPAPVWTVDGILPERSLAMLYGARSPSRPSSPSISRSASPPVVASTEFLSCRGASVTSQPKVTRLRRATVCSHGAGRTA